MIISYRRFGSTYRSHLQGSSSLRTVCPETSVRNYHSTPRKPQKSAFLIYTTAKAWNYTLM